MATILHTSDTHLDVLTYNESRAPDHDEVLAEIVEIARQVKPDLVLHTGDLASLPFVHANRVLGEEILGDAGRWTGSYADYIHRVEEVLAGGLKEGYDPPHDVLIFAAHLHVAGAKFSRSERPLHISEIYGTTLEALPVVNFAAFGHIHRPQPLPGTLVTGEYAGSPIPIDFGEEGEEKSVVIYEATPQAPTKVSRVPLRRGRPLWRFTGTLDELRTCASSVGKALALVIVRTTEPAVDLSDHVRELLPAATLLQVVEECSSRVGSADRVLKAFKTLVEAVGDEGPPTFAEETLLVDSTVDGGSTSPEALGAAS